MMTDPMNAAKIGRPERTSKFAFSIEYMNPINPMRQILNNCTTAYWIIIGKVPIFKSIGINSRLIKNLRFAKIDVSIPMLLMYKDKRCTLPYRSG